MIEQHRWPDGSSVTEVDGVQVWHNGRADVRVFGGPPSAIIASGDQVWASEGGGDALTAAAAAGPSAMQAVRAAYRTGGERLLADIDSMADQRAREMFAQIDRERHGSILDRIFNDIRRRPGNPKTAARTNPAWDIATGRAGAGRRTIPTGREERRLMDRAQRRQGGRQ